MTDVTLFFAAIFTALTISEFSHRETVPGGFTPPSPAGATYSIR